MKKVLVVLVLMMAGCVITSCGGGGTSSACTFSFSDFTNGANASVATTEWNCQRSPTTLRPMVFYDDGTFFSSVAGLGTWSEVGCAAMDMTASGRTSHITNVTGSIASGAATLEEETSDGEIITQSCTLGDACAFNINDFTNGANALDATTEWSCSASDGQLFTMSFFDDETGFSSSTAGFFTWSQVGCQPITVVAVDATSHIANPTGSIASGVGTFKQVFSDGTMITVSCILVAL